MASCTSRKRRIAGRLTWMSAARSLLVAAVLPAGACVAIAQSGEATVLSRIHFGSCIKQQQAMPIFATINRDKPELFLFLGDNVYADTTDMDLMRSKYAALAADPGFARLRTLCPVMATWDDHDYGVNDGGADFAQKEEAQEVFVNFWGDSPTSPRRKREGVYESRVIGPAGRRVQIVMLDTRFFRSPLKVGERRVGGPYYPDDDDRKTMLGERQWRWLERQLQKPAELRLLVSSIQFIASAAGQETWANLPLERRRMIELIGATDAQGVIFLSGDRHWADLSVQREQVPYPLYDLTSSSLNQLHQRGTPTENSFREPGITTFHEENYGIVEIDWNGDDTVVQLSILDKEGEVKIDAALPLSDLRAGP